MRWDYRESKTGKSTSLQLEALEFIGRFLQHILPRSFARVRTFGWFHPAAKMRANRVRALLGLNALLTTVEKQSWEPSAGNPEISAPESVSTAAKMPLCPHCQKVMRRIGSWHPTRPLLYPIRPP